MVEHWIAYVKKFDQLVEEALKICVKNSLNIMLNTLRGGTLGPSPLIKLQVTLKDNRVYLKKMGVR